MKARQWLETQMKFCDADGRMAVSTSDMGIAQSLKGAGMLSQLTQVVMGEQSPAPTFKVTGKGLNWLAGYSKRHRKSRSEGRIRMPPAGS